MSDELDPGLRRLFAETAEHPADEAFVAGVGMRTARARRSRMLGRVLAVAALAVAIFAAVATGLVSLLDQGMATLAVLVISSPAGWVAGLALGAAGMVCVRTLAPVLRISWMQR